LNKGITGEAVHTHEHHSDDESLNSTNGNWWNPVLSKSLEGWHIMKHSIDKYGVHRHDEKDSQNVENKADGVGSGI